MPNFRVVRAAVIERRPFPREQGGGALEISLNDLLMLLVLTSDLSEVTVLAGFVWPLCRG